MVSAKTNIVFLASSFVGQPGTTAFPHLEQAPESLRARVEKFPESVLCCVIDLIDIPLTGFLYMSQDGICRLSQWELVGSS